MPIKDRPDHTDVNILLQLYDLRREKVMRESRTAIIAQFNPQTWEDLAAITTNFQHPLNAAYRQVSSYWEMAASFVRHGVLNGDMFAEQCGEGLIVYAKILPHLAKIRESAPTAFRNLEWLVENNAEAKRRLEMMQARLKAWANK